LTARPQQQIRTAPVPPVRAVPVAPPSETAPLPARRPMRRPKSPQRWPWVVGGAVFGTFLAVAVLLVAVLQLRNRIVPSLTAETARAPLDPDARRRVEADAKRRDARSTVAAGDAHRGKGEFDAALKDYDRAIQLDGELASAYVGRAAVYVRQRLS